MKVWLIGLGLLAVLGGGSALFFLSEEAEQPIPEGALDFKGLVVGSVVDRDDVGDALDIKCSYGDYGCTGSTTVAGAPATVKVVIDGNGRLQEVFITFDSEYFDAVLEAAVKKFGAHHGNEWLAQRGIYWWKGSGAELRIDSSGPAMVFKATKEAPELNVDDI